MKKHVWVMFSILLVIILLYGEASPGFKKLDRAIKNAVPGEYTRNRDQSWDNKFFQRITFDRDGFETNQLIFSLDPGSQAFSPTDLALNHRRTAIEGRAVLFNDGTRTGKSILKIILKNQAGLFSITFQSMEGRAMSMPAMENILSKVNLDILEE